MAKRNPLAPTMTRRTLLKALENLRRRHCCYMSEGRKKYGCDCKFGADKGVQAGEVGCGCPELACAIEALAGLTPTEWQRVLKRTQLNRHYR
jgi:hypothetical protein